jgi:chromosome segregation ATPase
MPEIDAHLNRINDKLQLLLKQYAGLQKENEKLREDLRELKKMITGKDEYIALLSLRIEVLKAIKGEMTEAEKKAFEKKISQYLKEIDKCIAYLND